MAFDTIGDIIILKFRNETKKEKLEQAKRILEKQKNIKTILEKVEKVSGRLRTLKLKFLAGKNTRKAIHKESGCLFKLNLEKCYFSPRMCNDRLEIAKRIKKGKVLVMFSGVAPYPIIIAKKTLAEKITCIELGRECSKCAKENVKINKLENIVEIIQGDVKRITPKLKAKFDYIVMARPQLKDTFLKEAFKISKKGTIIFYHGFGKDIKEIKKEISEQAKKHKTRIKFLEFWKNGDIAPYTYRWTVVFRVE